MQLTDEQTDKVGRMLGLKRETGESQKTWSLRVWKETEHTWERINEIEREASELKRTLYSIFQLLRPLGAL